MKNIFQENIYGNTAIVYHRTRVEDLINRVYTEGWKPGHGDMYGKGFYSTYTIESQLEEWMEEEYGEIIVKFAVHGLENFFIFDYEEFKKSPNYKLLGKPLETEYLQAQFERFNIDYTEYGFDVYKSLETIRNDYSSKVALWCVRNIPKFTSIVDGIIFTGAHDGNVLVSYKPNINIIPLSFTLDDGLSWRKVPLNMEYLRKLLTNVGILRKKIPKDVTKKLQFEDFGIIKFRKYSDKSIDVFQDVDLSNKDLKEIPFKFRKVYGSFWCDNNQLSSLKNCPDEVYGHFSVKNNNLVSLDYLPKIVVGSFYCDANFIEEIHDFPIIEYNPDLYKNESPEEQYNILSFYKNRIKYINPDIFKKIKTNRVGFYLRQNKLQNLDYFPDEVYYLDAGECGLTNIRTKGSFEICHTSFVLEANKLTDLVGAPKIVKHNFMANSNPLTSLKGCPKYATYMYFSFSKLSLDNINVEDLPDKVEEYISILGTPLSRSLNNINKITLEELKKSILAYKNKG